MSNEYKKYQDKELIELATIFKGVCDDVNVIKARKAELEKEKKFLAETIIPELMDDDGINSITIQDVGRLTLTSDVYVRILVDKRQEAREWLRMHGLGDIITETVNGGTLKATVKSIMKNPDSDQLPEDLFTVTPFSRASITKI